MRHLKNHLLRLFLLNQLNTGILNFCLFENSFRVVKDHDSSLPLKRSLRNICPGIHYIICHGSCQKDDTCVVV